ncbi:MAG TPA: ATP-binding protein, partial [Alphaproteobacteria bacterium]|nr:ATP-binding protein [Alphaproteobacteria bacterium]
AGYVGLELRRRRSVEALVVERTHDLATTNETLRHEGEAREIAQGELARAGDQLRAMIDASPAGIVCVDPELRVMVWNKSAERIFGYRADEVVGRVNPLIPDEERDTFVDAFERVLQGRVLRGQVGHRKRKDGTVIVTSYSAAPFHDSSGTVQGAVYACEDATERGKLEAQLLRSQKLETVGQLTGGLAHDFNNILGAVIGNLDLLSEGVARDSALAGYCREALDAALSGAELVKSMLAFSRRQPLRPKPMDINAALAAISPLVSRAIGERVGIETRFAKDLWPAIADPVQLESAVLNLAVNARDAMPDGGTITIATENRPMDEIAAGNELEPGDYVAISVADTGTGIAPEVLAHVFEPFFTTKGPGKGSGLGLSTVFGTMKQLGGTARIYSEVGVGTTVRLYLPRALSAAEAASAARDAGGDAAPRGTERILLVEDNAQIRSVGAGILEGLGYRVTVAESGDAALRRAEDGAAFDLLFTDVVMPGKLNGIGLAHALRARDAELRILFASGFTSPMTVRTEIDRLGAELLLKPYRRIDLARAVRQALDAKTKVGA